MPSMSSPRLPLPMLLSLLLCAALPLSRARDDGPRASEEVQRTAQFSATGMLLVAARGMADPRFKRSVVLLVDHGRDGAIGLIVNHPLDATLADASPDFSGGASEHYHVHIGGPTMTDTMMFLVRSKTPLERARRVLPGLWLSGSRQTLQQLIDVEVAPEDLRIYVGHSGWRPGQLEGELAQGDWHLTRADASQVFAQDTAKVWPRLIDRWEPLGIMARGARLGRRPRPG